MMLVNVFPASNHGFDMRCWRVASRGQVDMHDDEIQH